MNPTRSWWWTAVLRVLVLMAAAVPAALAQDTLQNATVLGTVNDATGGALPGVQVEITGVALQQARTAITEASGEYRLSSLPPGVYQITYSIPGFQSEIQHGVTLPVGFTARIDVTLKVGAVEESVQVTGQSPLIDTTTSVSSSTLNRATLDAVPTTRSIYEAAYMAPGVRPTNTPDVGGSQLGNQQAVVSYGVSGTMVPLLDGINTWQGGSSTGFFFDYDSLEDVQVRATGSDADVAVPGTSLITVMKAGGNTFHGTANSAGETNRLQATNVPPSSSALAGNRIDYFYDVFGDLGGRLLRDKWWFYGGWHVQKKNQTVIGYLSPDGGQGFDPLLQTNQEFKTTFQASKNIKLVGLYAHMLKYQYQRAGSTFIPFGSTYNYPFHGYVGKGEVVWTPKTNLLIDILGGIYLQNYYYRHQDGVAVPGNPWSVDIVSRQVTGPMVNTGSSDEGSHNRAQTTGSLSYYPTSAFGGKHSFQAGYLVYPPAWDGRRYLDNPNGNYQLQFNTVNGVAHQPYQILTYNSPLESTGKENVFGAYAKDTWRLGQRLTLNLGVRYDQYHVFNDEQSRAAGQFAAAQTFPALDILTWRRVVPRLGAAWDPTGHGRTVVRASYGQYGLDTTGDFDSNFNPASLITTTYRWSGPCVVTSSTQCDAAPATLAGLQPSSPNFVTIAGGTTGIVNPDLRQPIYHTATLGAEHELVSNLSVRGLYVYNRIENNFDQVNVLRPYSAYTIPVPRTDPQTGDPITLYTYPASLSGTAFVGNMWLNRTDRPDYFHSFELTATRRKSGRWMSLATFSLTKNHQWIAITGGGSTAQPQSPNQEFFPLNETWDWTFKALGSYDFPLGLKAGAVYHYLAGTPNYRTVQFTGVPQLGTVAVPVEQFGSQRNPPSNQLNLKVARTFSLGKSRLDIALDLFNVLNDNAATTVSYQTGPTYGTISAISPPRIARIGASWKF